MKFIILLYLHFITSVFGQVNWENNNWAKQCDFNFQDLSNAPTSNDQCGPKCLSTPRCTHFTWTSWNGGTCWMKYGQASKSQAFLTNDPTMVCGVNPVSSSPNTQYAFGISFDKQNYRAQVNNELETYASSQVSFSNNNLIIEPTTGNYLSGAVVTRRKIEFKYGFVEVKAKISKGTGLWPAIWLLNGNCDPGWPCGSDWPPEIDIMEARGDITNRVTQTVQYGKYPNNNYQEYKYISSDDLSSDFHSYSMLWMGDKIDFFVDNIKTTTISDYGKIPHQPLYLVINLAIGGDYPGKPNTNTWSSPNFVVSSVSMSSTFVNIFNGGSWLYDSLYVQASSGMAKSQYHTWVMQQVDSGFFKLKSTDSGLYLDSNGNGDVYLLVGNEGRYQNWILTSEGYLVNQATNRVLDVNSHNKAVTSIRNGVNSQKWGFRIRDDGGSVKDDPGYFVWSKPQ